MPVPSIVFLDPGGDAVQALGYFNEPLVADGTASFDTTQKVIGVGSYKFDSGASNGNPFAKAAGILGTINRIGFYFRYSAVPDTDEIVTGFATANAVYSGGGFTGVTSLGADDASYATATPAKNGGQGSALSIFGGGVASIPVYSHIDSVKVIYERKYDTADSVGVSRVKWRFDGVEGPDHDNTAEPTTDTIVTVDITSERSWTREDLLSGLFEIIIEARRGDSDTAHTQSWDYVKLEVAYRVAVVVTSVINNEAEMFTLGIVPTGSNVVLQLTDFSSVSFLGTTLLAPNIWHRISVTYIVDFPSALLDVKLFVEGVEELSLVDLVTVAGEGALGDLYYGWLGVPGANISCWFDQIYVDDAGTGTDLTDPGLILMTAKLPASVNANNFDTTGGTGAVNERPLSETNYKQHAATSLVKQNYTLQVAGSGDVDLTGKTLTGFMGWVWAKRESGFANHQITVNGTDYARSLTAAPGRSQVGVTSASYPSNAAGIGLESSGAALDTFLYECGVIVAYLGTDLDNPVLPFQLLTQDTTTNASDAMGGTPPTTYELRSEVQETVNSIVTTTVSSSTAEGEAPQQHAVIESRGGREIGVTSFDPGVEVSVSVSVTGADTNVELRRTANNQ